MGRVNIETEYKEIFNYVNDVFGQNLNRKEDFDIEKLFTHVEIEIERQSSSDLTIIREQLLNLIRNVLIGLENKIEGNRGGYYQFLDILENTDTFITYNWDLLLDNIMKRESMLKYYFGGSGGDIGTDSQYSQFINKFTELEIKHFGIKEDLLPYRSWQPSHGIYLKAHGSIDWFLCINESCRGFQKLYLLLEPLNQHFCAECHEQLESLLIPPVLNKGYRNYPIIRRIWNLAAKEIEIADEVIIWGYSLQTTDFHTSWLLRQARKGSPQKLIIINPEVINRSGKLAKQFIGRFFDILRGKIEKTNIHIFESFEDYLQNIDVLNKYNLGTSVEAYKRI